MGKAYVGVNPIPLFSAYLATFLNLLSASLILYGFYAASQNVYGACIYVKAHDERKQRDYYEIMCCAD